MNKHTREQWIVNEEKINSAGHNIATVNELNRIANAKRIVQCVNNFDELLEACKHILQTDYCSTGGDELLRRVIAKAEGSL